jgi:transketolase
MRNVFINQLIKKAEEDERIWLLTADLGFSVLEPFIDKFPNRYINIGIAEQNMIGISAGLAKEGMFPFCYSIANFIVYRCFEQIRNDIAYPNLPVTLLSVGGGFAYGSQGYTHHATEDIGVLRTLPNIKIVIPNSKRDIEEEILATPSPRYIRLEKLCNDIYHKNSDDAIVQIAAIGKSIITAYEIVQELNQKNIKANLIQIKTIKPINIDWLRYDIPLYTIEDHSSIGGLKSAILDVATKPIYIHGYNLSYPEHISGSCEYLTNKCYNKKKIIEDIRNEISYN